MRQFLLMAALLLLACCGVAPSARADIDDRVVQYLQSQPPEDVLLELPKLTRVRQWLLADDTRGDPDLDAWKRFAIALRGKPDDEKIGLIQSEVNRHLRFSTDLERFGQRDYWETPDEVGSHDCDGYTIFKFWLAHLVGFPYESLALLVGHLHGTGQMHAVLLIAMDGHDDVLDNLRTGVISQAAYFMDFRPLVLFTVGSIAMFTAQGHR